MGRKKLLTALIAIAALFGPDDGHADEALAKIRNVVVIYAENRSFDHLYGFFPGANGIANATAEARTQLDHDGKPLPYLVIFGPDGKPDPRFPQMPNGPFQIDSAPINGAPDKILPSPIHAFYHNQEQINGGRNNMFAAMSTVGGWTMGYFGDSRLRMMEWAKQYTLADNFFMGAFGGSYLNHQYLICACTPRHPNAPDGMGARLDPDGRLTKKPSSPSATEGAVQVYSGGLGGQVTPDGYSVNTTQPPYQPSGIPPAAGGDGDLADPKGTARWGEPLPPQTARTIGDSLSEKGVSWAWYAGGWSLALADGRRPPKEKRRIIYTREDGSPDFQPHHQPFNYYARFAPGTTDRAEHLKDGSDFLRDIENGTLPQVSFYKPVGIFTQHPLYTDLVSGDAHIDDVLNRLRGSPQWNDMAVIVTYDENGGFWDHVPPPRGPGWSDRFGPGTRIPALIISPYAKRGFVDKTAYDTTSILKFITRRFDLESLAGVREKAGDLSAAFEFGQ
jgi:acid phosphatase